MNWPLIAALGFLAAAGAAVGALRLKSLRDSALRRTEKQTRLLKESPLGLLEWDGDCCWRLNETARGIFCVPAETPLNTEEVISLIVGADRSTLTSAVEGLIQDGAGFDLTVRTADDNLTLNLTGQAADGLCAIWLRDDSAATWLARQFTKKEAELDLLHGVIDTVPHPIWWRQGPGMEIIGRNRAMLDMLDDSDGPREFGATGKGLNLAQLSQRTGLPQSESRHLVLEGDRRAFDVTEMPVAGHNDAIAGTAVDMTALENLQMSLAEHIGVQDQVLEELTSAIAIFGPDQRLKFFNDPYAQMWHLTPEILHEQPAMGNLLELLREKRQLQETSDFPAFKRRMEQLFTSVIDPQGELIHLPDGRTVRSVVSPHPLGGLIFQYEDVTDRLALESSHNTLTAVQRSTLDSLFEGVCVFGRDGRLKLFNNIFAGLFGLDVNWLRTEPHIADVSSYANGVIQSDEPWDNLKKRLIKYVSEPKARNGRMGLCDGRVLDYAYVPLPDGQCLVLYLDVTDSTQVEKALREKNQALENADLLKSRFISNVSYELRTPLNAIMGFAELLRLETFGDLTSRQKTYVSDIFSASTELSDLIGDILDLAAVQAGFMEFERMEIDLVEQLEDMFDRITRSHPEADRMKMAVLQGPAPVRGDARRLSQALRYLVIDALRHIPDPDLVQVDLIPGKSEFSVQIVTPVDLDEEEAWSRRVAGSAGPDLVEQALATGADIGVSLARSLIQAQGGVLSASADGTTLECRFPAVVS